MFSSRLPAIPLEVIWWKYATGVITIRYRQWYGSQFVTIDRNYK